MKFNHIGIPTKDSFAGEIPLPRLKITVSDHKNNPFGIQWQRYWDDASYPELVKTVAHVAFEVDDLEAAIDRVVMAGGSKFVDPTPVDGYTFAMVKDPEGNPIGLIKPF